MPNTSRDTAAEPDRIRKEAGANEALDLMVHALHLLDENEGPEDAGAHLDRAIDRLREWLDKGAPK